MVKNRRRNQRGCGREPKRFMGLETAGKIDKESGKDGGGGPREQKFKEAASSVHENLSSQPGWEGGGKTSPV